MLRVLYNLNNKLYKNYSVKFEQFPLTIIMFMKKVLFIVISFCYLFAVNAQSENWVKYLALKNEGITKYNANDFVSAESIFEKMLSIKTNFVSFNELKYYLLCLIENDKIDESKPYLFQFVNSNCFDIKYFDNVVFDKIKQTKFWTQVDSISQIYGLKCRAFIDSLALMVEADQNIRKYWQSASSMNTRDSLKNLMLELDDCNVKKLKLLIEQYGFPTWRLVGVVGCHDAWLIAQHAKFEFQEWFLTEYKKAVDDNNAERIYLAYLVDRSNLRKKIPQIYGTQGSFSGSFQPIENIENLNFKREEMNLPPLDIEKMKISDEFWQYIDDKNK